MRNLIRGDVLGALHSIEPGEASTLAIPKRQFSGGFR